MSISKKYFRQSPQERSNRRFSESFKRQRVKEITEGKATVLEVCRAYEVSDTSVYRWVEKYSSKPKAHRTIVESKSDTQKILSLQKRVAELERLLGQKQVELEFTKKMIEIAEETYGIDIKKKSDRKR